MEYFDDYEDWMHKGECVGTDNEIFFSDLRAYQSLAKKICAMCQVREECLDYALRTNQYGGIWGGMNPVERRRERSRSA